MEEKIIDIAMPNNHKKLYIGFAIINFQVILNFGKIPSSIINIIINIDMLNTEIVIKNMYVNKASCILFVSEEMLKIIKIYPQPVNDK